MNLVLVYTNKEQVQQSAGSDLYQEGFFRQQWGRTNLDWRYVSA
ncbi:hypothetical protein [Photobacterium phosphoreum]|nr:hypothetical protein [Photobacterium phosphoreum]